MKKMLMLGEALLAAAVLTSCGVAEARNISADRSVVAGQRSLEKSGAASKQEASNKARTISGKSENEISPDEINDYPQSDEEAAGASGDKNRSEGTGDISNVTLDYGSSGIYTKEDMDAAIARIEKEFSTWKGCTLNSISYTSDDCNNEENLKWMNELKKARTPDSDNEFTQCIEFQSTFHSPKDQADAGAFDPDEEYSGWSWWLARTDGGEWHLMTWGY